MSCQQGLTAAVGVESDENRKIKNFEELKFEITVLSYFQWCWFSYICIYTDITGYLRVQHYEGIIRFKS